MQHERIDDATLGAPARQCFDAVAAEVRADNIARAGELFIASWRTVPKDQRDLVRRMLNEELLAPRQLEISQHGIKRTFRFWSREEKASLLDFMLMALREIETGLNVAACLGYGTALAVARSGDLIPHDDDVDFVVSFPVEKYPSIADALVAIERLFEGHPELKVWGKYASHRKVNRPGKFNSDVFVGIQEGEFFSSYPGPRRKILIEEMFPAATMELFGREVPVPRDLNAYLTKVYGSGWRVPDPLFGHNWDASPFSDLMPST